MTAWLAILLVASALTLPDERDDATRRYLSIDQVQQQAAVETLLNPNFAFARANVVVAPTPADYIIAPAPVAPPQRLRLHWAASDTNTASYAVQWSPDLLDRHFRTVTNTAATDLVVTVPAGIYWQGFLRVLSVDQWGFNSLGGYER
jgi:hypothetical protein